MFKQAYLEVSHLLSDTSISLCMGTFTTKVMGVGMDNQTEVQWFKVLSHYIIPYPR